MTVSTPTEIGSRWHRLAAYVLDWVIIWAFTLLLGAGVPEGSLEASASEGTIGGLALFIGLILYFPISTLIWHATPGKRVFKLRVVDQRFRRASLWQLFLRETIGRWVGRICFGHLWILFSRRKRAAWDFLAGTIVVYAETRASTSAAPDTPDYSVEATPERTVEDTMSVDSQLTVPRFAKDAHCRSLRALVVEELDRAKAERDSPAVNERDSRAA